jgi:hypothetical protein
LGFEEGFAVSGEGMEEDLAVSGFDQEVHVGVREEVIGGEDSGLFIAGDFVAWDAGILGRGVVGKEWNSHENIKLPNLTKDYRMDEFKDYDKGEAGCYSL